MNTWNAVPLTEHMHPRIHRLAHLALPHDVWHKDELHAKLFRTTRRDSRLELAVLHKGELIGVITGFTHTGKDGEKSGHIALLAVAASHRRQGVATALLNAFEARLRALECTKVSTAAVPPEFLWPGVDTRNTAMICFLEARGFAKTGEIVNLTVDLRSRDFATEGLSAELARAGVTTRRPHAGDRERLDAYMAANWSASWRAEMLASLQREPATGFIAEQDGEIVGFTAYDIARRGWFGPIGTDPKVRGLGVGKLLLYLCLEAWQDEGLESCEIVWIGPLRFYASTADAVIGRVFWNYARPL